MKLKIALNLQTEEIQQLLAKNGITVGQAELTALFRKPDHKNFRHCKAQFLRNVLQAIQDHYRPKTTQSSTKNTNPKKTFNKLTPKPSNKTKYVNPNLAVKEPASTRKVLTLKPEDIYKQ